MRDIISLKEGESIKVITFGDFLISELKNTHFSPKESEILAFVIYKKHVSVENVLENVWDINQMPCRNDITVFFSKINKKLKNIARLNTKDSIVSVVPNKIETDFENFERLSLVSLDKKDTKSLKKAFDIYNGDFLPSISSDWALSVRMYYRQAFFEVGKYLVYSETNVSNEMIYLKKMIDLGLDYNVVKLIVEEIEKRYEFDLVYEDFFDYVLLKNKLMRFSSYIGMVIIFDKEFPLEDNIRKGDIILKIDTSTYKILIERNWKLSKEKDVELFLEKLKDKNAKIKKVEII